MRNDIIGRRQLRWPGYPLQLENFFAKSLDLESYPCIFRCPETLTERATDEL